MLKAVIIEDDSFAREMLTDLLDHHANDFTVVGFFDSVKSALKSLPSLKPDLVFLDMELTDGKGFDILEQLPEVGFEVIVTTMYDSYMLKAIEHSALDYLLTLTVIDHAEMHSKKCLLTHGTFLIGENDQTLAEVPKRKNGL